MEAEYLLTTALMMVTSSRISSAATYRLCRMLDNMHRITQDRLF
jgi:hypothetical protein